MPLKYSPFSYKKQEKAPTQNCAGASKNLIHLESLDDSRH